MAGAGDDIMGGSERSDQIWGGTGRDTLTDNLEHLTLLDFSKPEKGTVDGANVLVYGYPKRYELDYIQGDAVPGYASSPMTAQPLFGVGCRERSAAKRNVESRHLTPINDLRWSASRVRLPAASPLEGWLAGHDAREAINDAGYRQAA